MSCNFCPVQAPFSFLAFSPLASSSSQIHLSLSIHVALVTNGRRGWGGAHVRHVQWQGGDEEMFDKAERK